MDELLDMLAGGDLRSEGKADEVALRVIANPDELGLLAKGLSHDKKLIRARTCMALEIISRTDPELLLDSISKLIDLASTERTPQARWHLAEIFTNTELTSDQVALVIPILLEYLSDKSKIVAYCSVMALGKLGRNSPHSATIIESIKPLRYVSKSLAKRVDTAIEHLSW